MSIHEVSKLAGVSVRTLHHYDAIGLLPPTTLTEAGYRLYDDTALARLQSILLFRELEFPLKDIKRILDDPNFDQAAALEDQIKLLELRRKQLGKLIALARETLKTGVTPMKFDAFDKTEQARFAAEVKEKWGGTAAYREYQQREENGSAGDFAELMARFAELGKLKNLPPPPRRCRPQSASCSSLSPTISTPVHLIFWRGWVRCMSPTSVSARISTRPAAKAQRHSYLRRLLYTVGDEYSLLIAMQNLICGSQRNIIGSLSLCEQNT